MRTSDFLSTLGVNTHIDTPPYDDANRIADMMAYIGFRNARQSSPIDAHSFDTIQALGMTGVKIDLIVNGGGPVTLPGAMRDVHRLAPYLNAVENVNEAAIWPIAYGGRTGIDAAVLLQKDLYAAVHADPALAGVPVFMFTIGGADPGAFPSIGDLSPYADYANIHSYPPHGLRPIFVIHAAIDGGRTDAPSRPVVITETGYYTLPNHSGWGGVPESVQASNLVNLVLDEAAAGVARTYLYDLIDDGADPAQNDQEAHFGLFHLDGTPKLAAVAFHNLASILADPGAAANTFAPSGFSYAAVGIPYDYTGNSMLLEKSDGSHLIAIWNEQQTWDTDTLAASAVRHVPVTLDLKASYSTVLVFDPMLGAGAISTLHDVSQLSLDLTDHPLIVQVMPPAPPPIQPPVAPPAPAPGGIVLHLSEDAYQGDAQFTVAVDGVQVGGVRTATASHAAGASQALPLDGDFGPGSHEIAVTFLNDAWGGTAATDRNLYVDGIDLGGVRVDGSTASLFRAGPAFLYAGTAITVPSRPGALALRISGDSYAGDARFTVAVDGVQVGGTQTARAAHGAGATQDFSITGALGAGPHTVAVSFINDAWGGTPETDRNLYVDAVDVGGVPLAGSASALTREGTATAAIPGAGGSITFGLSEDAWQGDALALIAIDGQQIGGPHLVTASHALGLSQSITFAGALTAGPHTASVSFVNDGWGGTAATDRNLFVDSIAVDGVPIGRGAAALMTNGTASFGVAGPGLPSGALFSIEAGPIHPLIPPT